MGAKLVEHGFDSSGDARILIRGGQEVGDAREDAHVGLLPDLSKTILQKLKTAASEELATRHHWTGPRVRLRDVLLHVGVADYREDSRLRHDASRAPDRSEDFFFSYFR